MKPEITGVPYRDTGSNIQVRTLVRIRGYSSVHIVVTRDGDLVDLLPLTDHNGKNAHEDAVKQMNVADLYYYNGCITIDQKV